MHFLSKLLSAACLLAGVASAELSVGQTFPDPTVHGVAGNLPSTKGKVVLYDFWASWCGPCRKAIPAYEQLYRKHRDAGLVVIGVGTDRKPEPAEKFLAKLNHSFPVCFDFQQRLVAKVRPPCMPSAYLVGRDGKVVHIVNGFHGNKSVAELEAAIRQALR